MRRPLIAGNWKMHKTVAETGAFLEDLLAEDLPPGVEVVCCPTLLSDIRGIAGRGDDPHRL